MEEKKQSKTWLIVILILILVGALCVSIYYIYILNEKVTVLEEEAIITAAIIREIEEKPQVTVDNAKGIPVITGIGEKITGDRYSDDELEDEIKLYRYTEGDRYEYFDIEYTIMGQNNKNLKIVNNTTNKTIFNEKTDKDIVDIIINDNKTTKEFFEAIVLFSDGTVGEIKTNKLTQLSEYKNISRIQAVDWKEGNFNSNRDNAYYSSEVIVAIDKDGKVYPVSIIQGD